MICPFCQTDNRDDREECYHCKKDISMLRLIVNKAKHHYNQALEYAERGRVDDAIGELKNALDLDGSLVAAHVVLGSLYARKEMLEEARRCWDAALGTNHNFLKAHDYLHKAQGAEYVFPAVRRLRTLAATLAAVLVAAVALALWLARPDRGLHAVHGAIGELAGQKAPAGQIAEKLNALANDPGASAVSVEMAQGVLEQLERGWREDLELAVAALAQEQPYTAIHILDLLEARQPARTIRLAAAKTRAEALGKLRGRVMDLADRYYAGTAPYEELEREASNYLKVAAPGEDHDKIAELATQARADHGQRLLAEAAAATADAPLDEAIAKTLAWRERNPDLGAQLDALLDRRLALEADKIKTQTEKLIAKDDADQARQQIELIGMMYQKARRPEPAELLGALRAQADARRQRGELAKVRAAFEKEEWETFIALTADLDALTRDEVERAKLADWRAQALRGRAAAQWNWFDARDAQFEEGTISAEDAARALSVYQETIEHLPGRLRYARGPLLFYAASASFRLGQMDQARALLTRVRAEHPKSYIVKSANAFEKKHAAKLNAKP
jgi:hypothetical protein